jgi:hypothetical protein
VLTLQLQWHQGQVLLYVRLDLLFCMQWCVQVLPECGSFRDFVHQAIFPAALKIKKAEDAGKPKIAAVSAAVPDLLKHILQTMACKEMCEATVNTCSCKAPGGALTFGQALEAAQKYNTDFQKV